MYSCTCRIVHVIDCFSTVDLEEVYSSTSYIIVYQLQDLVDHRNVIKEVKK